MRLSVVHHLVLATGLFSIILITGILFLSHLTVLQGIEKAEQDAAPQTATKILAVLSLEGDNLAQVAYDWGVWDDTYLFLENKSGQYIRSNLALPSLVGIQVNDILFFDRDGKIFYSISADYRNESTRDTSEELLSYLQQNRIVGQDNITHTGVIPLSTGPVLVATHPILKSDESGPSRGTIVIGRDLDEGRISYLSAYTLFPFSLILSEGKAEISESDSLLPALLQAPNSETNVIMTSSPVTDIAGKPSLVARMGIPFSSPYTPDFFWTMIILVAGLSALFMFLIIRYYQYYLARHITDLSVMLDDAILTGSPSGRLTNEAPQEITRLAESAERVTISLHQNRHDLHRSTEELEAAEERWQILFEEAIDPMCVGNEDGIVNANRSWVRLFGCKRAEIVNIPLKNLTLPLLSDTSDPMVHLVREYYSVPDEGSTRFDWKIIVQESGEMIYDVSIKRIRFRGELLRFVVARDITTQVHMEEEQAVALARIDENLAQLGSLNDEIRNPLTVICGLLEIAECDKKEGILLQVQKIDSIIDRLDRAYMGSEKVRRYLKRYFDVVRR